MEKSIEERVQETHDRFDRVFGKSSDQPNNDHANGMHSRQNKEDQDEPRKTNPFPEDIQRRVKLTSERFDRIFNKGDRQPAIDPQWMDIPLDAESQMQVQEATLKIEALECRIDAIHAAHELKHGDISPATN